MPSLRWQRPPPAGTPIDRSHRQAAGLIGLWPFTETGGDTAYDVGPYRRHMSFPAGQSREVQSKGLVLSTNGTAHYGTLNTTDVFVDLASGPFTIAGWFYLPDQAEQNVFVSDNAGAVTKGWSVVHTASEELNVVTQWSTTDFQMLTNTSVLPVPPAWQHLVIAINGSDAATSDIYVNGAVAGLATRTSGVGSYVSDDAELWLARKQTTYTPLKIADLRFYQRVLTPDEARDLYVNPYAIYEPRDVSVFVPSAGGGTILPFMMHHYG